MKPKNDDLKAGLADPLAARTALLLFIAAFLGTTAVALLIQLVLLPYFLPQLHAGHGMLVGGDSAGMHAAAAALADRIRSEGWSVWELRPASGNAPTGIAAAIYVYLTPEPYMLVPLNALVHAAGGVVIYLIAFGLSQNRLASVVSALPFLVFPSAASWYAQIHKDGIFALGMLLCALGWMQAFKRDFWGAAVPRYAALLMPIALGLLLVWVVRPHIMVLMQVIAIVIAVFGVGMAVAWWRSGLLPGSKAVTAAFVLMAIPVLMVLVKPSDYRVESWKGDVVARESVMRYMPGDCLLERGANATVDKLPVTVAAMRNFFTAGYRNAKSNMDPEFVPGTVCNLLTYVPRALQIGFLAPFPSAWLADGSIAASTMMRRVISAEMVVTYMGLLLLPLAFWRYRRKPEFWFVLGFCTLLTLIHVYLIPNLGTLYRMRYGFVAAVVGIAISAAFNRAESTTRSR
jgi:putative peptidoglycan lipid II flippase